VLVEDDASIRRLVELTLQGWPIELKLCDGVASARAVLREAPPQLLITDVQMPGESGWDLLRALSQEDDLHAPERTVLLSAGITTPMGSLSPWPIWRELRKPFSTVELEACLLAALGRDVGQAASARLPAQLSTGELDAAHAPIERFFGGQQKLYAAFVASVRPQFAEDIRAGDAACAQPDLPALRRLAHNLGGIFDMLGDAHGASLAREMEAACLSGSAAQAQGVWAGVRAALEASGLDQS